MERIWYELEQVMTENKNGKADKLDLKKKVCTFQQTLQHGETVSILILLATNFRIESMLQHLINMAAVLEICYMEGIYLICLVL